MSKFAAEIVIKSHGNFIIIRDENGNVFDESRFAHMGDGFYEARLSECGLEFTYSGTLDACGMRTKVEAALGGPQSPARIF